MKNEKGITIVSLIITIIVMLILAGTVIAISISGDDGVIKKAKDAKKGVEDFSLYETLTETVVTSKKKNGKVNFESLQNKLESIDNTINFTYDNTTDSCTVELGDKTYNIGEYGSITEQ